MQFGPVTLVPGERLVLKDGRPLSLTPKAFDLLVVLADNPGRLLTKDQLMEAVWPDAAVEEANLAYHVFALRKALGESPEGNRYIETVPKRGYRFVAPVVSLDVDSQDIGAAGRGPEAMPDGISAVEVHPANVERRWNALRAIGAGRRSWLMFAAGAVIAAAAFLAVDRVRTPAGTRGTPVHFQEAVAGRLAESGTFAVSPNGRHLVFAAEGPEGVLRLQLRTLSVLQQVPLAGAEVFAIIPPPFWSPDSRFVAFDATGVIKRVSLDGGVPQPLCELPATTAVGGSWNRRGDILLGNAVGGLLQCPEWGGPVRVVTTPIDEAERHILPSFLSDGRRFLYLRVSRTKPETSGVYVGALDAVSPLQDRLLTTGFGATFVPARDSGPGVIVFARDEALWAQRFDEQRLMLIGSPFRLAERVGSYLDSAFFSVSQKTLVFRAPEPDFQLAWFDRQGREVERIGAPARFSGVALSPDGNRVLVTTHAPQGTAKQDLWLFDLSHTSKPRRVTFAPALERGLAWATNDMFVFGAGGGETGMYQQTISGDRPLPLDIGRPAIPTSISTDGRVLLFATPGEPRTGADVWLAVRDTSSITVKPLLQGERDQWDAQLSPDARWLAYVSNETGPSEVFITRLHAAADGVTAAVNSVRISEGGGFAPRWRHDGRELFYLTPDGSVMAVDLDTTPELQLRKTTRVFKIPAGVIPEWGVTADGMRFLFAVPVSPPPPFNVVQDWQSTLPQ